MDILVTTPKSAHKLAAEEAKFVGENPDAYWFRTLRGKPNVQIGDKPFRGFQGFRYVNRILELRGVLGGESGE